MNFNDLYRKIASFDTPVSESADVQVDECGGPMPPMPSAPKQTDSVTMNVSMNGSGAGGIKDLLDILKNIEEKDEEIDLEKEVDGMEMPMIVKSHEAVEELEQEALANSPNELYGSTDEVLPSGDDLHKSKDAYPKAAGGDNPMNLKARLESLYQEIKNR